MEFDIQTNYHIITRDQSRQRKRLHLLTDSVNGKVMLVGQDERFLSALVVVNVPEAIQRGLIDPSVAQALQEATAKGPQGLQQLRELAAVVDANEAIRNDLRAGFDSVGHL